MRSIRLGVIFDQRVTAGGGYQQALNASILVRKVPKGSVDVAFFTTIKENIAVLAGHGIQARFIRLSFFDKLRAHLRWRIHDLGLLAFARFFERYSPFEGQLIAHGVDLVYFLSPSHWAQSLEELNYIITVWDLSHRDDPEFPEVRWNRQIEVRERKYKAILSRALAIFVDSEFGRQNAAHRYGVCYQRIHIMPFEPSDASRRGRDSNNHRELVISDKYQLSVPYIYYPAQFWPHKNHVYILEGLRVLEDEHGIRLGAVFSGSEQRNLSYIKGYAQKLGLEERIRFTGFVENDEVVELYRQSIALVMPSYFGPTNLPPLEAFQLGVPVLYSDKAGLREQVNGAALLMDLKDPSSMALHLRNLIMHRELREHLIEAGFEKLTQLNNYDRLGVLVGVIEDFRWRRICWE